MSPQVAHHPNSHSPSNSLPTKLAPLPQEPQSEEDTLPWTGISVLLAIIGLLLFLAIPMRTPSEAEMARERTQFELQHSIAGMQAAIEDYRLDHDGRAPGLIPSRQRSLVPAEHSASHFLQQLTMFSSDIGVSVPQKLYSHPYGPYLSQGVPINPINGSRTVLVLGRDEPVGSAAPHGFGWMYDPNNNELFINEGGRWTLTSQSMLGY